MKAYGHGCIRSGSSEIQSFDLPDGIGQFIPSQLSLRSQQIILISKGSGQASVAIYTWTLEQMLVYVSGGWFQTALNFRIMLAFSERGSFPAGLTQQHPMASRSRLSEAQDISGPILTDLLRLRSVAREEGLFSTSFIFFQDLKRVTNERVTKMLLGQASTIKKGWVLLDENNICLKHDSETNLYKVVVGPFASFETTPKQSAMT